MFTYTVNPDTGAASFVGQTAAALAGAADVPAGWDVNSTASDRTRYVNTNDENARINLDNGALAANDIDLTRRRRARSSPPPTPRTRFT